MQTISEKKIKLTIGIPVYNEEKNILKTLNAIFQQDFQEYNIIISDNHSTDNTVKIIEEIARENSKIHLIKNTENRGALENWKTLVHHATGKYFIMAGAHDLWSKNYLSGLVTLLDNNNNAVLACGKTVWIDKSDKEVGKTSGFIDTTGSNILHRYNQIFWGNQNSLYGLYRLSALKKIRYDLKLFASGTIMLNELSILGDIVADSNVIWYRRETREKESREQRLNRYYKNHFKNKKIRILPYWKLFFTYLTVPFIKADLPFTKRLVLTVITFFNFLFRYSASLFIFDPLSLLKRIFRFKL